jgi:hypothetical protein
MKFLSNKHEPQSAEDTAFAERLHAIANRGRGIVKPEAIGEFAPGIPRIEQHSWTDLSDHGEAAAA